MPRETFQQQLDQLHVKLVTMGSQVDTALEQTIQAFETQNVQQAEEVIKNDAEINDARRAIESACFTLLLRQQPVASDLRNVSAALQIVTELERIGDQAADIAELICSLKDRLDAFHLVHHIPQMARCAKAMLHDALLSYINNDAELAQKVMHDDDQVDDLFNKVKFEVAEQMHQPDRIDNCIDILMIAKYLERIGDHAVNICEWLEFAQTGSIHDKQLL